MSLDKQIAALEITSDLLVKLSNLLDVNGLTGVMETTLRAACHASNELADLKRRRGNADDVLDQAAIDRTWANVMRSVREQEEAS